MVGRGETTGGILFQRLPAVFAEAAHRAHVLARDRDGVARLEPVADPDALSRLGPGRRLPGCPGAALHQGSRRDGTVRVRFDRGCRLRLGEPGNRRAAGLMWIAGTAQRVDLVQPALAGARPLYAAPV